MADTNLDLLLAMARALGPLRARLVFMGGCATGLISQPVRLGTVLERLQQIAALNEH